jgi:hypothetical protein
VNAGFSIEADHTPDPVFRNFIEQSDQKTFEGCHEAVSNRLNPEEHVSVLDPQEFFSQIQLAKRKET